MMEALQPEGELEQLLADRIASAAWRLRRVIAIEPPDQHLSAQQFGWALLTLGVSAALWWWFTRLVFVPATILTVESLSAWATPRADERPVRRLVRSLVVGGIWAAVGVLVFGGRP